MDGPAGVTVQFHPLYARAPVVVVPIKDQFGPWGERVKQRSLDFRLFTFNLFTFNLFNLFTPLPPLSDVF